jgi:hypothetical protein
MALVMKENGTVYKEVHNNKRKTGIFTTADIQNQWLILNV